MKAAHFGGGSDEEGGANQKDRKTVIEELIAESKKRKVEKLRENEEIFEKTKALDDDWKDLIPLVNIMKKTDEDIEKAPQDDYDKMVREMVFEPRGEPAEKLKTEEEIARQEKQRLENLERERLFRMRGEDLDEKVVNHRSADDLDDGYFAAEEVDEDGMTIGYEIDGAKEDINDELGENKEEAGDESVDEEEGVAKSEESGEDEVVSEDSESEDNLDDLKESSDSESDVSIEKPEVSNKTPEKSSKNKEELSKNQEIQEESLDHQENQDTSPKKQKIREDSHKNQELKSIPYTIQMPKCYEDLVHLLEEKFPETQATILERIIKTNHQRLLKQNREKMIELFAYLMQYLNDLFSGADESDVESCFKVLELFTPHIHNLAEMNPIETSKCFQEVMKEKYEAFKKSPKNYPSLECLCFFRLLGFIYPTSDYRHPVVTPCYVFIHHILSQARVKSRKDVASGLFLTNLLLDQQSLSRRFLPAAMNFLHGICYLGVRKSMVDTLKPIAPFKKNPSFDSLLVLNEELGCLKIGLQMSAKDLVEEQIDDSFKVCSLFLAISLISDFMDLFADHVGVKYLVDPFLTIINRLSDEDYFPTELKRHLSRTLEKLEVLEKEKRFVYPVQQEKKQKMLRMLEPKIETVYCDRRQMYSVGGAGKVEQQKLKRQVKREFKDAKRELRRDNEFLAKLQLKRKIQRYFIVFVGNVHTFRNVLKFFFHSDRERQEKVKRIFSEASVQQSEYNALQRTKGRRNKF